MNIFKKHERFGKRNNQQGKNLGNINFKNRKVKIWER